MLYKYHLCLSAPGKLCVKCCYYVQGAPERAEPQHLMHIFVHIAVLATNQTCVQLYSNKPISSCKKA